MSNKISVSNDTIWRVILAVLLIWLLFFIRDVLALFLIAIVFASAFDPIIDRLQKVKIPRPAGIIIVYLVFFGLVGAIFYKLAGPIRDQVLDISKSFPAVYDKVEYGLKSFRYWQSGGFSNPASFSLGELTAYLSRASAGIFNLVTSIFGGILSFFMILVLTFYLTVQENNTKDFIAKLFPRDRRDHILDLIDRMRQKVGSWFRGQIILSVIVFAMVYIGLSILGIKYALILALLAGMLEIVPFLGPLLSAIPGIFFGFTEGTGTGLIVALIYFIVQQIENNIIVPKVMGKSTGLNPVIVIFAILAGARLAGVVGALMAVPVVTMWSVFLEDYMAHKN